MNRALTSEVLRIGGDPADPVWQWFLLNGPHGRSFTWSQTRKEPPGYCGLDHLREIIAERAKINPFFPAQARTVAERALTSEEPVFIRRAIQVMAAAGGRDDAGLIEPFVAHRLKSVSNDAKACLFELKRA